jgi:carbamoyl-phosphate synthase large subunit
LRGLETGLSGLDEITIEGVDDPETMHAAVIRALGQPTPDRLLVIAQAFRHGLTCDEINAACSYEPWFLRQIETLVKAEAVIAAEGLPTTAQTFRAPRASPTFAWRS